MFWLGVSAVIYLQHFVGALLDDTKVGEHVGFVHALVAQKLAAGGVVAADLVVDGSDPGLRV